MLTTDDSSNSTDVAMTAGTCDKPAATSTEFRHVTVCRFQRKI